MYVSLVSIKSNLRCILVTSGRYKREGMISFSFKSSEQI